MTLLPYGPRALWVRYADRADEAAFQLGRRIAAAWDSESGPEAAGCVAGLTSFVWTGDAVALSRVRDWWGHRSWERIPEESIAGRVVDIPTAYSGSDLDRVAEQSGLPVGEVIRCHAAPLYRVHCLGFAPGFPYLGGLDPRLATPRLATPRVRVEAGSVAIGGEQTGIYSVPGPGGWNLIGRTAVRLFRPESASVESAVLLRAGDRLRFIPVESCSASEASGPSGDVASDGVLEVVSPGVALTVQDGGRHGLAGYGIPPGGAMDPVAARWANRLVDNPEDWPVLELCLQGQRFRARRDVWLALTGASGGIPGRCSGWSAFRVRAGEMLEFGPGPAGVWSYLAVPGGWNVERRLGSASSLAKAGLGPRWVPGLCLDVARGAHPVIPGFTAGRRVQASEVPLMPGTPRIRVWRGPQWDSFSVEDRERFVRETWTVTSQSDRSGYRLSGPALRPDPPDILSEPVLPGSIQVPASGQPVVTMPDGPTVGGYPKIAIVDPADLRAVAQCRPGQTLRFEWATAVG